MIWTMDVVNDASDTNRVSDPLLVVDGNNVMGSRPDGWWRDRAGAAGRLVAQLGVWAAAADRDVLVVFDGPSPAALARRVRSHGAEVVGARALLDQL